MSWLDPRRIALLLALFGVARAAPARGQSCTVTSTNGANSRCNVTVNNAVNITIGTAVELQLPSSGITLNTPAVADYNLGYQNTAGPTATVSANRSWSLVISASTATGFWTPSGGARADKLAGDLRWSLAAAGPYAGLRVSPLSAQIGSGAAATAATNITLYFQTALAWNLDKPGVYTLTVLYTLPAP